MMSYPGRISVGVLVIVIMVLGSTFLMVSGNGSAVRLQCMRRCVFSLFHCMIFRRNIQLLFLLATQTK
jgi:tRNA pseudouridine-54 N-methylase